MIPNVLSIAGVDPSGGAGIFADIKTFSALGAYGCGVVTALTAQNTRAVTGIFPVSPAFVAEELDTLFADVRIDAVKIGMIAESSIVKVVADRLERYAPAFVVIDPVMVAKSGDALMPAETVGVFKEALLPLATVITPNLPEAACLLSESPVQSADRMAGVAARLAGLLRPGAWVLLKGGHLASDESPDYLTDGNQAFTFEGSRIATKNTHGTGCTLSSAVAALLPQKRSVPLAVGEAKGFMQRAIAASGSLEVGRGHGPVHHFAGLWSEPEESR